MSIPHQSKIQSIDQIHQSNDMYRLLLDNMATNDQSYNNNQHTVTTNDGLVLSNPISINRNLLQSPRITIFVRRSTQEIIPIEVRPTESIESLKATIQKKTQIAPEEQRLILGRQLEDGKLLSDYHIRKDNIIHLISTIDELSSSAVGLYIQFNYTKMNEEISEHLRKHYEIGSGFLSVNDLVKELTKDLKIKFKPTDGPLIGKIVHQTFDPISVKTSNNGTRYPIQRKRVITTGTLQDEMISNLQNTVNQQQNLINNLLLQQTDPSEHPTPPHLTELINQQKDLIEQQKRTIDQLQIQLNYKHSGSMNYNNNLTQSNAQRSNEYSSVSSHK